MSTLNVVVAVGIAAFALYKLGYLGNTSNYVVEEPVATAPESIQRMIRDGILNSDKTRRADAPKPVFSIQPVPVTPKEEHLL